MRTPRPPRLAAAGLLLVALGAGRLGADAPAPPPAPAEASLGAESQGMASLAAESELLVLATGDIRGWVEPCG